MRKNDEKIIIGVDDEKNVIYIQSVKMMQKILYMCVNDEEFSIYANDEKIIILYKKLYFILDIYYV